MHRVVVLALERVIPFDLGIPFQVFGDARDGDGHPLYSVELAGRRRGLTSTSAAFGITTPHGLGRLGTADTVVVVGSDPPGSGVDGAVRTALRRSWDRGVRLLSICTGAYVLAEAGLLDGRRATTHWRYRGDFRERYPDVAVDTSMLYTGSDRLFTSAGAAAGIDLCLHVVSLDHGASLANIVARSTVSAPHRPGGQAQFIESPLPRRPDDGLADARAWVVERLGEAINLDELARYAAVSRRTLIRRFVAETGATPLQWMIGQRILLARGLLERTDMSMDQVADECGFGSAATLRLRFRRALGVSPRAYREAFGHAAHESVALTSTGPNGRDR